MPALLPRASFPAWQGLEAQAELRDKLSEVILRRTKNLIAGQARCRESARARCWRAAAWRRGTRAAPAMPSDTLSLSRSSSSPQLPKKLDYVVYCELTGLQLEAYR